MRFLSTALVACVLLSGCYSTATPTDASGGGWGGGATANAATTEQRLARWEREWQDARQTVATARAETVAAGQTIPPEVDRQVTDLLNRRIPTGQGAEARIEDLQDAVSDALRLAELVSIG